MATTPTSMNQLGQALGINLSQVLPTVAATPTTLGFYGVTPVAKPSAYTIGNAGTSKTTQDALALIGVNYPDDYSTIQAAINSCIQNLNALITDLKALGLVQ